MKEKILRFIFGYDHPVNMYEQSPLIAWIIIIFVLSYAILGSLIIFG